MWCGERNASKLIKVCKKDAGYGEDALVYCFPQSWASTALGYEGIGGAAISEAYTVVIQGENRAAVYFGSEYMAYEVATNTGSSNFWADLYNMKLLNLNRAVDSYDVTKGKKYEYWR